MLTEKFETALSLLDNPKETIELIIADRPVFFSMVIFMFANASFLISNSIVFKALNSNFIFILIFVSLLNFLILLTTACSYHFIAEMLKGRGNVITLFALLNFSMTPVLLMLPAALIGEFAGAGIYYFSFTVIFCWTIYLTVYSIKILYNISLLKTLLVIFSPVIAIFLLSAVFLVMAIAGIISLFV